MRIARTVAVLRARIGRPLVTSLHGGDVLWTTSRAPGGREAVERVLALDGVPQPVEVHGVSASEQTPRVDELRARHLIEKAPARAAVLSREIRKHVRCADRNTEREIERTKVLFEEYVEHACGENSPHGASLDDERDAAGLARDHRLAFWRA